jgi:hypothetical protein
MGVYRLTAALRKHGERTSLQNLATKASAGSGGDTKPKILVDAPALLHWLPHEVMVKRRVSFKIIFYWQI